VDDICNTVCSICSTYFHTRKSRYRKCKFSLATAIRTVVVVIMAWAMVFFTHAQGGLSQISRKSWIFLILSGIATGASWLCYYKALQTGDVSKVVPIDKMSVVITIVLAFVFFARKIYCKITDWLYIAYSRNFGNGSVEQGTDRAKPCYILTIFHLWNIIILYKWNMW